MTLQLPCEKSVYTFSKDHPPVMTVASPSRITIETYDCFTNQLTSVESFSTIDWEKINPATGPIYIEDAEPGDILKVVIEEIEVDRQGILATGPQIGVLGHRLEKLTAKAVPIEEGKAIFNEQIRFPLQPMIGVIGVAPAGEAVLCGIPGSHGGNLDSKLIREGTTLYFPVFVKGALFGLGDLHAAMGDGEIGGSGVEIAGKVTIQLEVIKGHRIPNPRLENENHFITISSAPSLDQAVSTAVEEMVDELLPYINLSLAELTMLFSAVGETQISQVVNPLKTARFAVPKWLLEQYKIPLYKS